MKISKMRLSKIIKEELDKEIRLDKDFLKRKVIKAFINANANKSIDGLVDSLKEIVVEPARAIEMLSPDEVDPQFYSAACSLHNDMVKELGYGQRVDIEAFSDPSINHISDVPLNKSFMRIPTSPARKVDPFNPQNH